MNRCPSRDELKRLLENSSGDAAQAVVEEHVETCSACQDLLQQLAEAGAVSTQIRPASQAALSERDEAFLDRLKQSPVPVALEQVAAEPAPPTSELPTVPGYGVD